MKLPEMTFTKISATISCILDVAIKIVNYKFIKLYRPKVSRKYNIFILCCGLLSCVGFVLAAYVRVRKLFLFPKFHIENRNEGTNGCVSIVVPRIRSWTSSRRSFGIFHDVFIQPIAMCDLHQDSGAAQKPTAGFLPAVCCCAHPYCTDSISNIVGDLYHTAKLQRGPFGKCNFHTGVDSNVRVSLLYAYIFHGISEPETKTPQKPERRVDLQAGGIC
eukprot:XP_017944838.1 PREDICTED: uncharacterized protein LOC105945300 isoform X2 [Xenopus tropicalis]